MSKFEERPAMLNDGEYTEMMREYESASHWLAEQSAAKRASPHSDHTYQEEP